MNSIVVSHCSVYFTFICLVKILQFNLSTLNLFILTEQYSVVFYQICAFLIIKYIPKLSASSATIVCPYKNENICSMYFNKGFICHYWAIRLKIVKTQHPPFALFFFFFIVRFLFYIYRFLIITWPFIVRDYTTWFWE